MFGYCGVTSTSTAAPGCARDDLLGGLRSSAVCAWSFSSSKSRTIARISVRPEPPLELVDVDEAVAAVGALGRQLGGSAATISAAIRVALTSMSFAQPGCASTPWMVTITCSAENVSSCSSPRSEPSSV